MLTPIPDEGFIHYVFRIVITLTIRVIFISVVVGIIGGILSLFGR